MLEEALFWKSWKSFLFESTPFTEFKTLIHFSFTSDRAAAVCLLRVHACRRSSLRRLLLSLSHVCLLLITNKLKKAWCRRHACVQLSVRALSFSASQYPITRCVLSILFESKSKVFFSNESKFPDISTSSLAIGKCEWQSRNLKRVKNWRLWQVSCFAVSDKFRVSQS